MPKRSLFDQLDQAITNLLARPDAPVTAVDPEIAPLVRIASELRDLPRTEFMERLKSEFEEEYCNGNNNRTSRGGPHRRPAPRIAFKNTAKAIEFYKAAFGATETHALCRSAIRSRTPRSTIGDSILLLADEWPEGGRFSAETLGIRRSACALGARRRRLRPARCGGRGDDCPAGEGSVLWPP